MKFENPKAIKKFLIEFNKLELLEKVDSEGYTPSPDLIESFIKHRKKFFDSYKNFRKSQIAKQNWRKNRYDRMKGIMGFHNSLKGKKFHRKLGKFLATRMFRTGIIDQNEDFENLIGLSSLRTHIYIYSRYFREIREDVEFFLLFDEILETLDYFEKNTFSGVEELSEEHIDLLCRLVDEKTLVDEVSKVCDKEYSGFYSSFLEEKNLEEHSYVEIFNKISEKSI